MSKRRSAELPVTLSQLMAERKTLWAYCLDCQHSRFIDPETLPLPPASPVPEIGRRMVCSRCGSRRVHTRPDWYRGKGRGPQ